MLGRGVSLSTYWAAFIALLVLTFLTIGISFLDLGAWHTVAGLAIASCKAVVVALFFMHMLSSDRLTWIAVVGGFLWFAILIALTLSDYLTREWLRY